MASESCTACGSETVTDARFCHSCGQPLIGVIDVDLLNPASVAVEPDVASRPDTRLGVALAGVLGIAVIVGIVYAMNGSDTPGDASPNPVDDANQTASASSSTVEPGDEISVADEPHSVGAMSWLAGPTLGRALPVGFVDVGDTTFLFAAPGAGPLGHPEPGLEAWRSDDSGNWFSMGQVLAPPALVTAVSATTAGIVAAGTNADGQPTVWRSADGLDWVAEPLPAHTTNGAGLDEPAHIAAIGEQVVVVSGDRWRAASRRLSQALNEIAGIDLGRYGWSMGADDSLTLIGPLGITMGELLFVDLGMSTAEIDALRSAFRGRDFATTVWTSTGRGQWTLATIDGVTTSGLTAYRDEFVLSGQAELGLRTLESDDGMSWTPRDGVDAPDAVIWRDALVGRDTRRQLALRIVGPDGAQADVQLADVLPDATSRYLFDVEAGPGGLAVMVDYPNDYVPSGGRSTLVKDGVTITMESSGGRQIVIRDGRGELLRFSGYDADQSAFAADIAADTITVLDPDNGEAIVTFTVDDFRLLERQHSTSDVLPRQVLAISTDAEGWSINWLSFLTDSFGHFADVHVGATRVTVVVASLSPTEASDLTGTQIFTAELPA